MEYNVAITCHAVIEADSLDSAHEVANQVAKDVAAHVRETLVYETEVAGVNELEAD